MAAETEMNWYVLRAITGKEGKVKEYIEAEISNNTLPTVSKVLIPMEKTVQIRNGKRVVKEHNLMSGYVLVRNRRRPAQHTQRSGNLGRAGQTGTAASGRNQPAPGHSGRTGGGRWRNPLRSW